MADLETVLALIGEPAWPKLDDVGFFTSNRSARWLFELTDRAGRFVGPLWGVGETSLKFNVDAAVRSGGSLSYTGPDLGWRDHLVRVHYEATVRGESRTITWGTFIPAIPSRTYSSADRQTVDVELSDMMLRLDRLLTTASPYTVRKGANIIAAIRYLLDRAGVAHAFEDSTATLAADMAWPAGTKYRTVVNELLEAAGFFSVWADPQGVLRSRPYAPPSARGAVWTFRDTGGGLLYRPTFKHTRDESGVPNKMVAVAASDDPDAVPLVVTVTDTTSQFAASVVGETVTDKIENVPTSSLEALEAAAWRALESAQRVASVYEFETLPVPLALNDVVRFVSERHGLEAFGVVEKIELSKGKATMRVVVREVKA